jgi:hypothetical protein
VIVNSNDCSVQFDPIGKINFDAKSCDIAKSFLAKGAISYTAIEAEAGAIAQVKIGTQSFIAPDPAKVAGEDRKAAITAFQDEVKAALTKAGYPAAANPDEINTPVVIAVLTYLVLLVTMVYGPIAAMLVELFPTRIRYSGLSLPYHIGNGWFGGLMPATAFAISAQTGSVYGGLWYPIVIALMTVVIGALLVPGGTHKKNIFGDDTAR